MKLVKNFLFAAVFVCTLAFNTFAGDVETPGNPAPKPLTYTETPVITDTKPTGTTVQDTTEVVTSEPSDYLFYEALAALLSVY